MPWYWTDEVAPLLVAKGSIGSDEAASLLARPIAFRSERATAEEAAQELVDDGEIPLAA